MWARRAVRMIEVTRVKPTACSPWCLPVVDRVSSAIQTLWGLLALQLLIPMPRHLMYIAPRLALRTVVTLPTVQYILFQTAMACTQTSQNRTVMDENKLESQAQCQGRIWQAMDLQSWPLFEAWACMMATICSPSNATKTAMAEERVFGVYYVVEGDFSPDGKTPHAPVACPGFQTFM